MSASVEKRVIFVSTQMEAGGVQIRASNMLKSLQEEGTPAALVFLYRKRGVFDGVSGVHVLLDRSPRTPIDLLLILIRLWRFIRAFNPTAVVGFAHYSSPIASFISLLCGVKNRIGTQTNPPKSYSFVGRVLDWLCGTLGVYTANIATSRSIESNFARYPKRYRSTLTTVYNGIKNRRSALTKKEARSSFGLDQDAFLMVNTGRLSDQKNQAFLLEICARMPDAKLAILGEGELRSELETHIQRLKIEDRVALVGEISPERVPDFLRCGDVFLFPSRFEAFGLAVVEAMMAGLPVVSSNYPALVEVLGDAAHLLPIDQVEPWVSVVSELRANESKRAAAGALALERAKLFSFEAMFSGFKEAMTRR